LSKISKNQQRTIYILVLALVIGLPFVFVLRDVAIGAISFWYDPARDLLLALANLKNPTLIGQPAGIPDIFYGPYWIWILSLVLIFTHDPRFVVFFVLTLPYFIIFPFILCRFSKTFGKATFISLWLLFILSFSQYSDQLWNPHPAPLLFLILIYLALFKDSLKKLGILKIVLVGICAGLVMNFSLSFGMGVAFGMVLFYLIDGFTEHKFSFFKILKTLTLFILGLVIVFLPTIFFEFRHGFQQTQSMIFTFTQSFLYNSAVVGQVGLRGDSIILHFVDVINRILRIPAKATFLLSLFSLAYFIKLLRGNKLKLEASEQKLLLLLSCVVIGILFTYLGTKNPVWVYHFIGVEIIFLLFIGFIVSKIWYLRNLLIVWTFILLITFTASFVRNLNNDPLEGSNLASKENIVKFIYSDSAASAFSYTAYSPAIYTYDYDYLFAWLGPKSGYVPDSLNPTSMTYVIVPGGVNEEDRISFLKYKTPDVAYKTVWQKEFPDQTFVIKRVKK